MMIGVSAKRCGTCWRPKDFGPCWQVTGSKLSRLCRRPIIDLVLLDMHMPRMSGLQTLRLVKQYESRLPCILMSAEIDDAIEAEAEEADVYSILRKPVGRVELTDSVKQALRRTYGWG